MARWAADMPTSDKLLGTIWIYFVAQWGSLDVAFYFDIFVEPSKSQYQSFERGVSVP